MTRLWLILLPLLFLPTPGSSGATKFGELELSDFLMPFFCASLFFAPRLKSGTNSARVAKLGFLFVFMTLVCSLSIQFFYIGGSLGQATVFSLLKIAKFGLYGFAALMVARLLITEWDRDRLHWAFLGCAVITGISVFLFPSVTPLSPEYGMQTTGYKAHNLISVVMSIFFAYLSGLYLNGYGSKNWRLAATVSLIIMLIGFSYSGGRGGWMAAIAALLYYTLRRGLTLKTGFAAVALALASIVLFEVNPNFKSEIEKTFFRQAQVQAVGAAVDDGHRVETWKHEFRKITRSMWFGTGFFHRGPASGLWSTGSHNFWLQMFLETGVIGGFLLLFIFSLMWRHARSTPAAVSVFSLPTRAALVAVFVGGMSGEYFYGGLGLFTALLIYAPVGSLILQNRTAGQ